MVEKNIKAGDEFLKNDFAIVRLTFTMTRD